MRDGERDETGYDEIDETETTMVRAENRVQGGGTEMSKKRETRCYVAVVLPGNAAAPQLHSFEDEASRDAFLAHMSGRDALCEPVTVRRAFKMLRKLGRPIEVRHGSVAGRR